MVTFTASVAMVITLCRDECCRRVLLLYFIFIWSYFFFLFLSMIILYFCPPLPPRGRVLHSA